MTEYYAGMGCRCAAWSANECACSGVDWTPEEVYELSKQLKALQDAIEAIDPFDSSFEVDNAFEPEFICRCWHCDMEGNYSAEVKHTLDCPVTKLREVLKSQEVSDD